jgi:ribosomal protein S1
LRPGATVEGKISGITHFGVFIIFEHGLEGLILSSEIPTNKQLQVGQTVKARITEITNNKVYLSLKI